MRPGSLEACGFRTTATPAPRVDIYPPLLRPCHCRLRPSAWRDPPEVGRGLGGPRGLKLGRSFPAGRLATQPGRRVPGLWAGSGEEGGSGGGGGAATSPPIPTLQTPWNPDLYSRLLQTHEPPNITAASQAANSPKFPHCPPNPPKSPTPRLSLLPNPSGTPTPEASKLSEPPTSSGLLSFSPLPPSHYAQP